MDASELDDLCATFLATRGTQDSAEVAGQIDTLSLAADRVTLAWLATALQDEERKWFVAWVFRAERPVPSELFHAMIRAAVYERNPSANEQFVQPCLRSFGVIPVNEALLTYVENGTNFEKAGAVRALYWAQQMGRNGIPAVDVTEIMSRKMRLLITEFVQNSDIFVRRSIIPSLNLDPANYPDNLKPLVPRAIQIAREHSDDYIRHRVEVQLRNEKLLKPLPPRE